VSDPYVEHRTATGDFAPGLVPLNKKWDEDRCIDRALAWIEATGRPPSSSEWQPQSLLPRIEAGDPRAAESYRLYRELGCPNYSQVYRLFGSWTAFMATIRQFPYHVRPDTYAWLMERVRGDGA
jgi:hypothetical protein